MPLHVDVEPRIPDNFAQLVAEGVKAGIRDALIQIAADLSLTDDERNALEIHRLKRVALRRAAQAHVAKTAGLERQTTYNVTQS
jgi:hypothetical protein